MQFIDLSDQQSRIKGKIDKRIADVLAHGKYIMGPEIQELEEKLADIVGVKHCISCSSGTDALLMSLMALGVEKDDLIITTPFTFIATAEVIQLLGTIPVFVDIDPVTFNLDPIALRKMLEAMGSDKKDRLNGSIPVDLFGLPANYPEIEKIAEQF